ncbi:uncharacterized protein LOC135496278 [Lineus longissimus]|uniref:uncharacterized protein LOC135496278 n=1 Tax=Lineus longissimus TaxID=88925 RepID=UPI00315DD4D8
MRLVILILTTVVGCCSAAHHKAIALKPEIWTRCMGNKNSDQAGKIFNKGEKWTEVLDDGRSFKCTCGTFSDVFPGVGGPAGARPARVCKLNGCMTYVYPGKYVFVPPKGKRSTCNCVPGKNPGQLAGPRADLFHCIFRYVKG